MSWEKRRVGMMDRELIHVFVVGRCETYEYIVYKKYDQKNLIELRITSINLEKNNWKGQCSSQQREASICKAFLLQFSTSFS